MAKKILITGGSGLIGTRLTALLLERGHEVSHLTRSRNSRSGVKTWLWNPRQQELEEGALDGVTDIIHLAGAGIADKKWTDARKKVLIESRELGPKLLESELKKRGQNLQSFVSASGINYYGSVIQEEPFVETDPAGDDFTGECLAWEQAADIFAEISRVVKLRVGVVLARDGGALPRLAKPINLGVGSPLGTGKQYMAWVHLDDVSRAFIHAVENENVNGPYNVVSSQSITNRGLTKAVASRLRRPMIAPPVPAFLLRMLFGEMATLVLNGANISNEKLKASGFKFEFEMVEDALVQLYPRIGDKR